METTKETRTRQLGTKLLGLDLFKSKLEMKYEGGKSAMAACSGAILSMILVTIVVGFAAQKFNVVAAQSSAFITTAEHDSYYTHEHIFGVE